MSRKDYEEEKLKKTEVKDNDDQLLHDNETQLERINETMGSYDDQPQDPYVTDENGDRIYI